MAAAGGSDGTIVVWNALTASVQCVLTTSTSVSSSSAGCHVTHLARGHTAGVTALDWGPSGLVSVDRSGVVIHWVA
jgi:WD40 repeat protein